jgi:hypothetical protein
MSLQGVGEVAAVPDMAQIATGVVTQGKTAREALDANSAAMTELMATLAEAGLEPRDIQTGNFSVQPQYVYSDQRDESGYQRPPQIVGYQVSNSVTIRVREFEALGAILDRAVTVGANTINGISFSVEDPEDLLREARTLAVEAAVDKAETYASAAGVELGRIVTITEQGGPRPVAETFELARMVASDSSVPIAGGELTYSVTVSVEWELME